MPSSRHIVSALLIIAAVSCSAINCSDNGRRDFVDWAQNNVHPLATTVLDDETIDLEFLGPLVGDARVICLGESRHDAREQFLLKGRIIRHLVTKLGFNIILMEEGLPYAEKINQYVLEGTGDIEELMSGMGAWFLWDTEEVREMIQWLREYNREAPPDNKVRFGGIDITDPLPGLDLLSAYFERVDSEFAESLTTGINRDIYRVAIWEQIAGNYTALGEDELDSIQALFNMMPVRLRENRTAYEERSSAEEYEWAYRNAVCLIESHTLFRQISGGTFEEAGIVREKAMAQNVLWQLSSSGDHNRAIVWAHNFHVGQDTFDLDIPNRPPSQGMIPMGKYLKDALGEDLVSIGMSFYDGAFPDGPLSPAETESVDGALADIDMDAYMLDLRSAPNKGPIDTWLSATQPMRGQGGTAHLVLRNSFDIVAFVRHITKATPSPGAASRFESLR